jgi:hypothetical protein
LGVFVKATAELSRTERISDHSTLRTNYPFSTVLSSTEYRIESNAVTRTTSIINLTHSQRPKYTHLPDTLIQESSNNSFNVHMKNMHIKFRPLSPYQSIHSYTSTTSKRPKAQTMNLKPRYPYCKRRKKNREKCYRSVETRINQPSHRITLCFPS